MVARLPSPPLVPLAASAARPGQGGVDPAAVPDAITVGVSNIDPDNDGDVDVPLPYNLAPPAADVDVPVGTQQQPSTSVPSNGDMWKRTPSASQ